MNKDPQVSPREFSEAIQDLRDEIRRDVRGLAGTIERRPRPKPGISPLTAVASAIGSLLIGAAGMSVYDSETVTTPDAAATPVDVRADLEAAMVPYTQQLDQVTQALAASQQTATDDSKAHGLLLDQLAETVIALQRSAEVQNVAFHERVDLLADELAAKLARDTGADNAPTIAARPQIPEREASPVQPANVETDVVDAMQESDPSEEKPAPPAVNEPERGELVINNPSDYDLKLQINGEPLDIKARGVTTIDVTVGTVNTQIANFPETVKSWDQWKTVEGVKRLTINVESGNGYYKLQ
ncbi:MAG: hypothetical protein H8E66_18125 [Planctomycetes bacterium]|nr:hypothetical protein [Planctomycetota bacterium]